MIAFFNQLSTLISTVIQYFVSAIHNTIIALSMVVKSFVTVSLVMQYLPAPIIAIVTALVAYVVVINIINFGG